MQNKLKTLVIGLGLMMGSISMVYAQADLDYYQMARAEGKKNNFAKATTYCLEGLKQSPSDLDLKEYLGKCYLETGKLDQARMTLLDVLRKSPDRDDSRRYLITIESLSKRHASAICYVNELLETNPYDKDLWLKKVGLYRELHNNVEAEKSISRLLQIFPNDKNVQTAYQTIIKENASNSVKKENLEEAVMQYQQALLTAKRDPEMYDNLINTQIKLGNYSEALNSTNKAIFLMPNNSAFTSKKASILEAQGNYTLAISTLEDGLRRQNSPQLRRQLDYLIGESARVQANNDPYVLYSKLYAKNRGDQVALNYLLNTSIERGKYDDAQDLLRNALRSNPNSKDLLLKQVVVYERTQQTGKSEAIYERLNQLYPRDTDIAAKYAQIRFNRAKTDLLNLEYNKAIEGFQIASKHAEYNEYALQGLFQSYAAQKNKVKAMETINQLISSHPSEVRYALMKLDYLLQTQDYELALAYAKQLQRQFPNSKAVPDELENMANQFAKVLMANEKYDEVISLTDYVIGVNPDRLQPYLYGLNARVSQDRYEDAETFTKKALVQFPNHKDLRMRLAGIQSEMNKHQEAAQLLGDLRREYPYNDTLATAWVEQMMMHAKTLEQDNRRVEAIQVYQQVLNERPKDLLTSIKLLSLYSAENQNEEALTLVEQCLKYHPNNNDLIFQKAVIYENTGEFNQAISLYEQYVPTADRAERLKDHIKFLRSKNYRNSITASFTNVKSDSIMLNIPVASLEYSFKGSLWNTFAARVNYAGKNTGVGIQGEFDWYHTFKKGTNFLISAGVANQFFQKYKFSASVFQPFAKDWQVEIGGRYARLNNDANFYTAVLGLERTWKSVWVNAKAFYMNDGKENYYNLLGQSRFYMFNERDYLTLMAGIGNAPEDQRLDFQLNNFLSYANSMVGAGYRHHIGYKSSLGLMGNWYSYKMSSESYINQYNVSILFSTRF